ncbi:alcohol dehydrogenase catalytic domain-containing protein [Streptomyces violaceoruber]|uniref:zinc-dependent alcohol dehydrogenase n=1 Tax=Streptomyces violaceoruber TaxID=1935 RepID=UPI001F388A18|nr:alcohol dehydrogenase catalytic domain-containing protein [Streptomyces violaceoruber]MCF3165800.1 alcohol dehydrogenase catalytic domain-containing protein [Streptomyces violaceoruber]
MTTAASRHRAFLLTADGDLALTEAPTPVAAAEQVLVRVTASGVCGSDLAEFRRRRAEPGTHPPLVIGHEIAGVVAAGGTRDWPDGTPVVVDPALFCGRCATCERGRTSYCPDLTIVGHNYGQGGLVDYLAVPAAALVRVPPSLPAATAALVEPLSCAHHAVSRATGAKPGDGAAVLGAGAIGLGIALVLRASGFAGIVLVDPAPERRAAAAAAGFTALDGPPPGTAPLVFEASGSPGGFRDAFALTARGGHLVVAAQHGGDLLIDPWSAFAKEIRLSWSLGALRSDFEAVIGLLGDGQLDPAGLAETVRPQDLTTAVLVSMAAGARPKPVVVMSR